MSMMQRPAALGTSSGLNVPGLAGPLGIDPSDDGAVKTGLV